MIEDGLVCRTATEGLDLPTHPGVLEMAEVEGLARYVLRGRDVVIAVIAAALALPLDRPINRTTAGDQCTALRLGPDEWLLLIDIGRADDITAQIGRAAGGSAYSLVDISHRNTGLRLTGPGVTDALAAGCPQALDITRFPVGKCSRTVFAKAEVVLWRSAEHEFHLETWRSFVPYIVGYIASETVLL